MLEVCSRLSHLVEIQDKQIANNTFSSSLIGTRENWRSMIPSSCTSKRNSGVLMNSRNRRMAPLLPSISVLSYCDNQEMFLSLFQFSLRSLRENENILNEI